MLENQKLGLGSSAASAAAAAGAVFASRGHDLASHRVRDEVLRAALLGHRSISPKGSGADVAASVLGGFIRYRKQGESFSARPIEWPGQVQIRVVWTGAQSRTSDLIGRVEKIAASNPEKYRRLMTDLGERAGRLLSAVLDADSERLLREVERYADSMDSLGQAAGAAIVTETLRQIAALAARNGGAAKPSGAGGGDVAVAFFPDPVSANRFELSCGESGLKVLRLGLGSHGVCAER
jgi:phosphomevalonate kinase